MKKATVGISREIWCSNRETGRFYEQLGDSLESRQSWQVCITPFVAVKRIALKANRRETRTLTKT